MSKDDSDKQNSDEDLFRQAMGGVRPLSTDKATPFRQRKAAFPIQHENNEEDDEFADLHTETPNFLDFKRPGIQNRLYRDLQRGVITPEASLDLHGMRIVDARQALSRFLKQSLQAHHRCVRIIHGKGRGSGEQQAVLKQKVNQWLPQKEEVLAYCAAPRWDGGTGAAYVLLSLKYAR